MVQRRLGPLLVMTAIAALPAVAQVQAPPQAGPGTCLSILVSSQEETHGHPGARFSATKTTDLTFQVMLAHSLTGEHVLELRTTTPHGYLYRSISVPVVVGGSGADSRRVPGYPHPIRVVPPIEFSYQNAGVLRVDVPFPVGGTDIVSGSLYGRWQVQGFLDGSQQPCGGPGSFEVTQ